MAASIHCDLLIPDISAASCTFSLIPFVNNRFILSLFSLVHFCCRLFLFLISTGIISPPTIIYIICGIMRIMQLVQICNAHFVCFAILTYCALRSIIKAQRNGNKPTRQPTPAKEITS